MSEAIFDPAEFDAHHVDVVVDDAGFAWVAYDHEDAELGRSERTFATAEQAREDSLTRYPRVVQWRMPAAS